ncbi:MAG TPA: PAS domain S-box protein [Polyangiaceae bacterium]|nr:PAS domain S-box protein [Polyangiaceae bacterium]
MDPRSTDLLSAIAGIVWESDAQSLAFSFVSDHAVRLLGYALSDWQSPGFWQSKLHPEDRARAIASHAAATTSEHRMQAADGRFVWLRDTATAVSAPDGSVTLRGLMVDITDLKRSNELLREVIDTVPAAILGLDREGKVQTVWNAAAADLFGWSAEEVMGRRLPTVPAEGAEDFERLRAQVLAGHTLRGWEAVRQRRDGSKFDASLSVSPLYDERGEVLSTIAVITDISERKRAENALGVSHNLLNAVFQSTPDNVFVTDVDGRVLMINPGGARQLRRPVEQILGSKVTELFPPEVGRVFREKERRVIDSGIAETSEESLTAEGVTLTFLTTRDVYRDADGRVAGLIGIARDISDRKRAERERSSSLWFLESLDRVNRAIRETNEPDQMMKEVLDVVLAAFECDRAWLCYPCDPDAPSWRVPVERTRAEFPGIFSKGLDLPMDAEATQAFRWARATSEAITAGPGGEFPLPAIAREFQVKSQLCIAIYPKLVEPYLFGVHQCSHERVWTTQEKRLLQEIGRRLADGLTSLHVLRNLSDNESKLAEAEQMAHVGYYEVDFVGDRLILSEESCRILALPPGEKVIKPADFGSKWQALVHPEDLETVMRALSDALAEGPTSDVEYRVVRPDGEVRVIHSHGNIWRDQQGRPLRMFGFMQDVTERRAAEDRLRASEARFRTFVDHAMDAFFLVDSAGTLLDVNRQACVSLGYEREELIGMLPVKFDVDLTLGDMDRVHERLAAGEEVAYDTRHRRKDGTTFPVEIRLRPFWEGGHRYSVALARDMSERFRAQHALNLFRSLIDHMTDTVEVIDPETGRFLDVNEHAFRLHGYSREEYLSLAVSDIDPIIGQQPWAERIRDLEQAGSIVFESEHRRKDGSTFPVEVNANYIRLDREYLIAVVRDITARKRLEDQLSQAQKMEAVGRLAGGVAHDFNNLLTVINGYSELALADLDVDHPLYGLLGEIQKAGERGSTLTRQLLAFSRRQVLHPRVVNLNVVLGEVCRLLTPLIGEDIDLSFVPDATPCVVQVDPGQFEHAIVNLALNARDAMPEGGRLIIETRNVEFDEAEAARHSDVGAGRYALVAVSDSGHGMDAATLAQIFEPFFTTKPPGKGTGLGLAMVYGFVKQSGGQVEVYSEPAHGTTFKVYLPLSEESPALSRQPSASLKMPVGTETVLLVEDEDAVRLLSKLVLGSHGYVVLDARDGQEALQIAEGHPGTIHILVTDMVMPKMGGLRLAELLTKARPNLKVLFMSGYTENTALPREGRAGQMAFLQKPFSPMNLVRNVRALLDAETGG